MCPTIAPEYDIDAILTKAVDTMPVALSLVDPHGRLIFYNDYAPNILDRRPELIGRDVRDCHQVQASNDKIDRLLEYYRGGGTDEHTWQLNRDGIWYRIRVAPLFEEGRLVALVHTATKLGAEG